MSLRASRGRRLELDTGSEALGLPQVPPGASCYVSQAQGSTSPGSLRQKAEPLLLPQGGSVCEDRFRTPGTRTSSPRYSHLVLPPPSPTSLHPAWPVAWRWLPWAPAAGSRVRACCVAQVWGSLAQLWGDRA